MAHIYLLFGFAKEEEKAQQARHKLEGWKQAFRLDKKLLYKVERIAAESAAADNGDEKPAKAEKAAKGKKAKGASKAATAEATATSTEDISLLVRLGFSAHEKLTEERWVQRIPSEEPFRDASPQIVKAGEPEFDATEKRFEDLD
jgi:DNA primase catalytic subunit